MHISRIDLNLFVVLDAIHREGNLTRAAKRLHLTQPALSHALARLRGLLNDPLFERQGTQMVPTPLTRSLIGPVRQALQTLDATVNSAERFDPATTRRRLTIGIRAGLEASLLAPLWQQIEHEAPNLELASVRFDRPELAAELASGVLDLALDVLLPLPNAICRRRVFSDALVVAARPDHPGVVDRLNLDTYLALGHVLVSTRRHGPSLEDMELARHGHQRHVSVRCQHHFAACRVVAQSDLLLTLPRAYAALTERQFDLKTYPFPLPMPPLDVYLYWHENTENDAANRWLRERVMGVFGAG